MASKSQKQGCSLPAPYLLSVNCGNHLRESSELPRLEAAELTHKVLVSRDTAERKQEEAATGQDSTQEIKVLLLFKQLELDEDAIFPKYNGIGLGEKEVPRGQNITVPN